MRAGLWSGWPETDPQQGVLVLFSVLRDRYLRIWILGREAGCDQGKYSGECGSLYGKSSILYTRCVDWDWGGCHVRRAVWRLRVFEGREASYEGDCTAGGRKCGNICDGKIRLCAGD